jgi:hypothetical protein
MDPIVIEGLKAIKNRINMSTGFVHPDDKASVIELLKKLNDAGHILVPSQITSWALQNGFQPKYAQELEGFAAGVISGKKYKIGKNHWNENIIKVLEERSK